MLQKHHAATQSISALITSTGQITNRANNLSALFATPAVVLSAAVASSGLTDNWYGKTRRACELNPDQKMHVNESMVVLTPEVRTGCGGERLRGVS